MKKIKIAFAILLVILLFSGCSNKITQGEVTEKEFVPEHTQVQIIPLVTTDGESTSTILIPYVYHYPDTYKITIRAYDDDQNELTATYRVTKNVYDSVNEGDEFIYDKSYTPEEPEYTRKKQEVAE